MKRLFFFFLSICLSWNIFAQTDTIAEKLYKTQQYEAAIEVYQSIINQGNTSAELFYNLGNAYFKQNELAKAILYYEKAKLLAPNDKDIAYNLAFAYSQQPDNIETISKGFLSRIFQSIYQCLSVDCWAIIAIVLLCISGVFLCIFLFTHTRSTKKIIFSSMLITIVFCSFSIICAESRYDELHAHNYAIVIEPTTSIKTEPMVTANDLATIHSGLKVRIIDEAFGWYKIELNNGKEGWILAENIEKI